MKELTEKLHGLWFMKRYALEQQKENPHLSNFYQGLIDLYDKKAIELQKEVVAIYANSEGQYPNTTNA